MSIKKPVQKSNASDIKTLEGLEAIRKRPGMYIGQLGSAGVFRLFNEAVGNVLDLYAEEAADNMLISINESTGQIIVADNGYGMPIEKIEDIMTKSHTSGKFENNGFSIGMNGIGNKCINALSESCKVTVKREGYKWSIGFAKGDKVEELTKLEKTDETGTTITFTPDKEIMGEYEIDSKAYLDFIKTLSYLSKGLTIQFIAKTKDKKTINQTLKSENGHIDYIKDIEKNPLLKTPIYFEDKTDDKQLYLAMNYTNKRDEELILSFVNNMATTEHGTHVQGMKMALTSVFKKYITDNNLLQKKDSKLEITGDDILDGLTVVVELKWIEPLFDSQTKDRLTSNDAMGYVRKVVTDQLTYWLNANKNDAKTLCNKIIVNAKSRKAAKAAKEAKKKTVNNGFTSISSLSKYTKASSKDPDNLELFIVEGNSAGGSASQGRNTEYQAIYRLRGKPLNTHAMNSAKVINNAEFRDIVTILGCGLDATFDIDKLTHKKIIIMADADIDGSHICALMTAFFYNHMKELIEQGYVYCAMPPLYKIKENGKDRYIIDKGEYNTLITDKIISDYKIGAIINMKVKVLNDKSIKAILELTSRYNYILDNIASKFAADQNLVELIAFNKGMDYNDLATLITNKYPYLEANIIGSGLFIDGMIGSSYQSLTISDNLYLDLAPLTDIIETLPVKEFAVKSPNDAKARRISLYNLLNEVTEYATPDKMVRYKGLTTN